MRENRLSGLTSGAWKRGMESLLRHRQTKGPETDKTFLNYRATPRLYIPGGVGVALSYR
jgi:hypothetical protein